VFEEGGVMAIVTPEPTSPAGAPAKTRKSGVVVPHKPRWYQRLIAWLIFLIERLVISTLRVKWDDRSGLAAKTLPGPVIFCLWHNRLALCMCVWRDYVRRHSPKNGLAALISASKDGALLACTLEQFDVQPVRGSSSRRGPQALLELTSWLDRGYHLAITPDGPRGPRYIVQPGVAALSMVTGAPVIPVSYRARRRFTLRSWDQFQIPVPFSRCDVILEKPIYFPRTASDAERESLRKQLEEALRAITRDD
jgi:lysophospholipid acyltransferase (LPLAT)-like uncharacterized protein